MTIGSHQEDVPSIGIGMGMTISVKPYAIDDQKAHLIPKKEVRKVRIFFLSFY